MIDFDDMEHEAALRVAQGGELTEAERKAAIGTVESPGCYAGGPLPAAPRNKWLPDFRNLPEKLRGDYRVSTAHGRCPLIRLFVFYGAGDSYPFWCPLVRDAPAWVELAVYEWPGHGTRADEPRVPQLDDLVADAMDGLWEALSQHAKGGCAEGAPFAILGHSIGVQLAVGVAERARTALGLEPSAFFALDRPPPSYPGTSPEGGRMLRESPARFVEIFNPQAHRLSLSGSDVGSRMKQMWMDDLQFLNHTKNEGFHYFRCPLVVFVALENWANDSAEAKAKMDREAKRHHDELDFIHHSSAGSSALWDRKCYDDWRKWTVEDCRLIDLDLNHTSLKTDQRVLDIVWKTLEVMRAKA